MDPSLYVHEITVQFKNTFISFILVIVTFNLFSEFLLQFKGSVLGVKVVLAAAEDTYKITNWSQENTSFKNPKENIIDGYCCRANMKNAKDKVKVEQWQQP